MQIPIINHKVRSSHAISLKGRPFFCRPATLCSPFKTRFKAWFVLLILLTMYAGTGTAVFAQSPTCGNTDIGGLVYRDYNANSLLDAREPGLSGVTVTAYAANNSKLLSATTT